MSSLLFYKYYYQQRRFSRKKWISLVMLFIGVAIVQTSGNADVSEKSSDTQSRSIGLFAILCAACTSGFSAVRHQ